MANDKGKMKVGDAEAVAKALGLKSIAGFRRADLTSEMREKLGLSPADERRLMSMAELHGAGVPLEVARALSLGGAVGGPAELASLSIEEVEQVLQEEAVRRLLPEGFPIDRQRIEGWLELPLLLAADEEAPGRDPVSENTDDVLARDEDAARVSEDRAFPAEELRLFLTDLERSWERSSAALKRIAGQKKGAMVEADSLRAALADLGAVLAGAEARMVASDDDFRAVDEGEAGSAAIEDLDAAAAILRLQDEIFTMQLELEALRVAGEEWFEEAADAAASEEDADAEPVSETEE